MASYAHPEALTTAAWLDEHAGDVAVRVVDVRYSLTGPMPDEYAAGHIPGAVFCDLHEDTCDLDAVVPCRVAPPTRFETAMGTLGIDARTHVVLYDQDFGGWAARLWWALRYYGHDRVALLDGGLAAWVASGHTLQSDVITVPRARFTANVQPALRATLDDVVAARERDDVVIIDALPAKIYRGEALMFPTLRAGHIPGARNVPARFNTDRASGRMLSADQLGQLWGQVGITPDRRVITYCGAGDYGSFALFALHLIGHDNAALYDGCWLEWGAREDLPVEIGAGVAAVPVTA